MNKISEESTFLVKETDKFKKRLSRQGTIYTVGINVRCAFWQVHKDGTSRVEYKEKVFFYLCHRAWLQRKSMHHPFRQLAINLKRLLSYLNIFK